jgi:hypothetical protein
MAQSYQLAELGQVLTANVNANVVSLAAAISIGNGIVNTTLSTSLISLGNSSINSTSFSSNNIALNGQIVLNGTPGISTYVLTSNGSSNAYWALPTPAINAAATVAFTNTTISTAANTGVITTVGGMGVGDSLYVGNKVGYSNTSNVSVVYTYYNLGTNSLDTVFG